MLTYVVLFAVEHQTEDGVTEEGRETDDEISVACARWCSCWPGRMCCRNCYLDKQHYVRFINFVDWLTLSLLSKSARLFIFFGIRARVACEYELWGAEFNLPRGEKMAAPLSNIAPSRIYNTGYKKATQATRKLHLTATFWTIWVWLKLDTEVIFILFFFYVSYIKWYLFKKDPS